jgi:hypothetical protein
MSEVDELKRQLAWANGQLMARDRADAEARINAMAEQQRQEDDSANTERQAALEAEIERTRRGAWVTALLKNAMATSPDARFDPVAFEKSIPTTGWPPGISQADFHFAGEPILGREADDGGNTMLGKMLGELLEQTERVRHA